MFEMLLPVPFGDLSSQIQFNSGEVCGLRYPWKMDEMPSSLPVQLGPATSDRQSFSGEVCTSLGQATRSFGRSVSGVRMPIAFFLSVEVCLDVHCVR